MNMYNYIAQNNPTMAKAICHKYGYGLKSCKNTADLGICLQQLVAREGDNALEDIVKHHPDRDIILECNEKDKGFVGCDASTPESKVGYGAYKEYVNYTGEEVEEKKEERNANISVTQNNFLLGAAFIMGAAIISSSLLRK